MSSPPDADPTAADHAAAEAQLVARIAAGDRGAPLTELYRRYEGRLYGLGMRLLGDSGLAEELVQETFVRLWRRADRYSPERGTVATFVYALARRIAIDLWRRPSSRPLAPEPNDDVASGDAIDRLVVELTVRDAMESLSAAHQEVLELSYTQDMTQTQIAERLGLPLGTVKTRTYYALRALKLALEERGVDV